MLGELEVEIDQILKAYTRTQMQVQGLQDDLVANADAPQEYAGMRERLRALRTAMKSASGGPLSWEGSVLSLEEARQNLDMMFSQLMEKKRMQGMKENALAAKAQNLVRLEKQLADLRGNKERLAEGLEELGSALALGLATGTETDRNVSDRVSGIDEVLHTVGDQVELAQRVNENRAKLLAPEPRKVDRTSKDLENAVDSFLQKND
jgi:hypothetical protein